MMQYFHYNNVKIVSNRRKGTANMDDKLLRYTLRVDRLVFQKFRYVAEYNGRSANKEIEQYLKKIVADFEKEHGKIEIK